MNSKLHRLREEIDRLRAQLADREAALPVHSVRPQQFMVIEALEDEIARKQQELHDLLRAGDEPAADGGERD